MAPMGIAYWRWLAAAALLVVVALGRNEPITHVNLLGHLVCCFFIGAIGNCVVAGVYVQ